ncbi:dockerin type I repeat-containing protein [uncultured Ruminococcus sp.]|uniref:dockerin type I repeat-containing protein n=1 Tax=uncultured Ruminococcus sp. TaxID=165186 RepID=UPI002629553A|nr:dockerin type I repeat-containing protein [uncultured Ruminococcus sp.]
MKGTKRIISMVTAFALTISATSAMTVFAETNLADYPQCVSDSQKELVEASIAGYFTSWRYEFDGELTAKEDYTYSDYYAVYGFQTMEQVDTAIVLVRQNAEWIGYFSAQMDTDENGDVYPATYYSGVNSVLVDAVDNNKDFLLGTNHDSESCYWVNNMFRSQMIYVDGMTYDWGWDQVVGGDPSTLEYVLYYETSIEGPITTTATPEETDTTTATPVGGTAVGDINLDGKVDITDAVLMTKMANGSVSLSDSQFAVADCNSDGEFGAEDALTLLKFLVHLVGTLPYTG